MQKRDACRGFQAFNTTITDSPAALDENTYKSVGWQDSNELNVAVWWHSIQGAALNAGGPDFALIYGLSNCLERAALSSG